MKKIIHFLIILALPALLFTGCTKMMEDMNNDPKSVTNDKLVADGILYKQHIISMELNLFNLTTSWEYQVQQNLNADIFAGYTMPPVNFGTTTTNDNYNWNMGWNGWAFSVAQQNLTDFLQLKSQTLDGTKNGDFYAYGLILKVMTALPLVDDFGPFPYLQYGVGINPVFNNVDSIYKFGFIRDLTQARDTLEAVAKTAAAKRVQNSGADISTLGGDIKKWIKLANTLKLRLAMRISDVDPTDAAIYVQDVVSDPNGFLDQTTGDFAIDCLAGNANGATNPFTNLSTSWDNCSMSADMQSFLGGFQDPREAVYFLTSTDTADNAQGKFAGVRPGSAPNSGNYSRFSLLKVPRYFMLVSGAESYFLLAEAATKSLGGLTPSSAQSYYENGVSASFVLRGLTQDQATTYLTSTNTPEDYVDYYKPVNNYTATTTVTPKWDGTNMQEKIITQKWIALFPMGVEAWAEFRRTGFPKLMLPANMVASANFDGSIPAGKFAKRLPYPTNIINLNPVQATVAVTKYLNGKDDGYQKIWWMPN